MATRICKITTFRCADCSTHFEGVYFYDAKRPICTNCQSQDTELKTEATFKGPRLEIIGASDWNKHEFNYGLGEVTAGVRDAERKARARRLIAVGNENLERFNTYQERRFEKDVDETIERSFDEGIHHLKEGLRRARS